MSRFSIIFKDLRCSAGLTQQEIARSLDVSQSTITMWENGKRRPDLEMLESIADYFNVDLNYLTGNSDRTTRILTAEQFSLITIFDRLNEDGRRKLFEYARDLDASGRY